MLRIVNQDLAKTNTSDRLVTVLFGTTFDGWELPPLDGQGTGGLFYGGQRALIELAAGIAASGSRVELRGQLPETEIAAVERATGVQVGRPTSRRALQTDDIVIMPEGHRDPLLFARVALSPARAILFIQAALGMMGWSFDGSPSPSREEMLTFDLTRVGTPEQLTAAHEFGFELWTNTAPLAEHAAELGLPMHYVGSGRPIPYPEPVMKQVDVLVLGENRWAPLAKQVLEQLPAGLRTLVLPRVSQAEVLSAFSLARIVIHPTRLEGRSRVAEEARAMRAVPVLLASNVLGEGYGEQYGSVVVDHLEQMAPAITDLLATPERLERLANDGYGWARSVGGWKAFGERLNHALDTPDPEVARRAPGRADLGARLDGWVRDIVQQVSEAESKIASAAQSLMREREALSTERELIRVRQGLGR